VGELVLDLLRQLGERLLADSGRIATWMGATDRCSFSTTARSPRTSSSR